MKKIRRIKIPRSVLGKYASGLLVLFLLSLTTLIFGVRNGMITIVAKAGHLNKHAFITFFYSLLAGEKNTSIYCRAGHNTPIPVRKDGSKQELDAEALKECIMKAVADFTDGAFQDDFMMVVLVAD